MHNRLSLEHRSVEHRERGFDFYFWRGYTHFLCLFYPVTVRAMRCADTRSRGPTVCLKESEFSLRGYFRTGTGQRGQSQEQHKQSSLKYIRHQLRPRRTRILLDSVDSELPNNQPNNHRNLNRLSHKENSIR
jgi:hypothetical protein